jgi:protoheme IX farnesyltransferase
MSGYLDVAKPKMVALFSFTAIGAMIVAVGTRIPLQIFFFALIAVILGTAGANAITCYLDRDIDSVMVRTKERPLPAGKIYPPKKALYYGVFLSAFSLIISVPINLLTGFIGLLGLFDNIFIYSKWLKRRNPVNIVLGGFSGGMPVLAGYAAVRNTVDVSALLIAALVVLWIPTHIWSLAIRFAEDYKLAKIPMLPNVMGLRKATLCMVSTSILLVAFSVPLYYLGTFGLFYLTVAFVTGAVMATMNLWLYLRPSLRRAWLIFKLSSPHLAILFSAMVIDVLLLG